MESAIRQPDRAKQVIDYGGIKYGNIMPTDLDGIIEYKGKAYILIEMKHRNAEIPEGQRIALERMVDDFTHVHKFACLLRCSHSVDDCGEMVKAEDAIVTGVYYGFGWFQRNERLGTVLKKSCAISKTAEPATGAAEVIHFKKRKRGNSFFVMKSLNQLTEAFRHSDSLERQAVVVLVDVSSGGVVVWLII